MGRSKVLHSSACLHRIEAHPKLRATTRKPSHAPPNAPPSASAHLSQWEKKSKSLPILRREHHEEMMLTVMSVHTVRRTLVALSPSTKPTTGKSLWHTNSVGNSTADIPPNPLQYHDVRFLRSPAHRRTPRQALLRAHVGWRSFSMLNRAAVAPKCNQNVPQGISGKPKVQTSLSRDWQGGRCSATAQPQQYRDPSFWPQQ